MSAPISETVERHRSAFVRDWSKQLGAVVSDERAPWPRPEVVARPATDEESPAAARRLAAKARAAGWQVAVVFSRGTAPHGAGWAPGAVVDAVSVRCRRGTSACVGYWSGGRFAFGLVKADLLCGMRMTRKVNTKGLAGFLAQAPVASSDGRAPELTSPMA